ncbi:hypothetical protein [Lacrimispora sp.]|jgi:hypothetical protein|uniref:hypothetical protein n=1 Tax=Lacrimispora sp. TaxID=2719234 RepID=UPI0028A1AF7D|nr:hypothetical protein [Lacrimispora sp.]
MKNQIIRFILLCSSLLLIICFVCVYSSIQHYKVDPSETMEVYEEIEIKHETYLLERENQERFFRIEVNYPQMINSSEELNETLKNTAFSLFGAKTYKEAEVSLKEDKKDPDYSMGISIDYEILCMTNRYMSLIFKADAFYGSGPMYSTHYLATIDLETAKYITFNDLLDIENINKAIQSGYFEIYEGTYNEFGNSHDVDRIQQFIDTLGASMETEPPINTDYDRNSCQNIGIDKDFIYIYFNFADSLNGYIILKIPLYQIDLN